MKVGFIQFDVKHNQQENINSIEEYLKTLNCDIVVLPELCLCGYLFDSKETLSLVVEEVPYGEGTQKMAELSRKYNCTLIFGLAEKSEKGIYNTAVVVSKGKYVGKYRKIHLSDFEKGFFERGNENKVFDLGFCKIGVQICFDLWFPEISREQLLQGAYLFCVPANFGGETSASIAVTRATENLTPLVLCNRVGTEKNALLDAYFLGKSFIADSTGSLLCAAEKDKELAFSVEVELPKTHANIICKDFDSEIRLHYK